jgi:hypothetical protein
VCCKEAPVCLKHCSSCAERANRVTFWLGSSLPALASSKTLAPLEISIIRALCGAVYVPYRKVRNAGQPRA